MFAVFRIRKSLSNIITPHITFNQGYIYCSKIILLLHHIFLRMEQYHIQKASQNVFVSKQTKFNIIVFVLS